MYSLYWHYQIRESSLTICVLKIIYCFNVCERQFVKSILVNKAIVLRNACLHLWYFSSSEMMFINYLISIYKKKMKKTTFNLDKSARKVRCWTRFGGSKT